MTYDLLAITYLFIIILVAILISAFYFFLSYIREIVTPTLALLIDALEKMKKSEIQTKELHDAVLTLNVALNQVLVASRRRPTQTTKLPALLPTPSGDEQQ